jgi:hypothetical protein
MVSPSALAVIRLMTRSNLVGCSTGKSAGLRPTQNLVDVLGAAPKQRREVCSIGYKTARFDMLAETVHRRQLRTHCQNAESGSIGG